MMELNFVLDDKCIASVRVPIVPPEQAIIQIRKTDYIIHKIFWALDGDGFNYSLRAILVLRKYTGKNKYD